MKNIKSQAELKQLLRKGKPVLLDFYADWCGPCRVLLPIVEDLANEYEEKIEVRKVNVDSSRALAGEFGVRSIPALFFLHNGNVVDQSSGLVSKNVLTEKIENVLALTTV